MRERGLGLLGFGNAGIGAMPDALGVPVHLAHAVKWNSMNLSLDVNELVRTLTEPRNALVRQYQSLFALEDCELHFEEAALREVAKRALELRTGVRAARAIIESLMLDVVFHLPDRGRRLIYRVTPQFVRGEAPVSVERRDDERRESA